MLDTEISARDIQDLSNTDAVAALFARLRFNTDVRTIQTAANIGITAEGLRRSIRRIERIADQPGPFQVYLFELSSVTVSNTRDLARAFRNLAGNFLLVLTSDYERLDFVLLERYAQTDEPPGPGPASKQPGVRPRVITVERRKPTPVNLRVIRRLTWTEDDAFAQYDKLVSAFGIAYWSEEFFNNRALFSDYYLIHRLPEIPAWKDDPKPAYSRLRDLYRGAGSALSNKPEGLLRKQLFDPVLSILGFSFLATPSRSDGIPAPDYCLSALDTPEATLAFCLVYPWGRSLDGKDPTRDKDTPDENPGAMVVSLLEQEDSGWAVVTNGKVWRLYSRNAHSRATNYYEIDLEEVLAQTGPAAADPAEAFRYFWLLFRAQAFIRADVEREGRIVALNLLDRLLLESQDYARELGDRLKERVFERVFPHLAEGFVAHIRERDGADRKFTQAELDRIFTATLTLLYRLLFLLYAEARDLLPAKEARGYFEGSLTKLRMEVKEAAGALEDEAESRLRKHYRKDSYALYARLRQLFAAIDEGASAINVPVYNGGLFLTNPDKADNSGDAEVSHFLESSFIGDSSLACAIDLLARDPDPKTHALVFIDYKSLGVRQLGSIYEGLLEFRLRIATEKMAIVKKKEAEEVLPYAEAERSGRKILKTGRGKSAEERVYRTGDAFLENDRHERKASGSYYTPDHIVEYIVHHAVGPVLDEKFDHMRTSIRQAQQRRREREHARAKKAAELQRLRIAGATPPSRDDEADEALVDELFKIRVLDPAMGSGHFLVETVDFITDRILDFLNGFPGNPGAFHLERMRRTIIDEMERQEISIDRKQLTDVNLLKRFVLKRCVYGVDLNPMAVELAKVSLWLDCFTLGAPLSFLDHHLRCGNSLIGVTVQEVQDVEKGQLSLLSGNKFEGMKQAVQGMINVGALADLTSTQIKESRREYLRASDEMAPAKRMLDLYTSQWFGNAPTSGGKKLKKARRNQALEFVRDKASEYWAEKPGQATLTEEWVEVAERAMQSARDKRFFHWELEFPEVFYGPRPGTTTVIEKLEGGGFDAVVGNPPYDVLASEELSYDIEPDLEFFRMQPSCRAAIRGKSNLYKLFVSRSHSAIRAKGRLSFIVPMALLGDDQAAGVRRDLLTNGRLLQAEAFPQKDRVQDRVFPEAKLATVVFVVSNEVPKGSFVIRTHPGRLIDPKTPRLTIDPDDVLQFDPINGAIPSCTQKDWDLAVRILKMGGIRRMGDLVKSFQGEVNETNERDRDTLTEDAQSPIALRGANITMYTIREASQGELIRVSVKRFLAGRDDDSKAFAHRYNRIGFQRSSPQNNFRRLIAAPIPAGNFCLDTVSYATEESSQLNLDLLLALLNSKIIEWFFRLASTNSKVNEYQFNALPVPTCEGPAVGMDAPSLTGRKDWSELADDLCRVTTAGTISVEAAAAIQGWCRRIQAIEQNREIERRSERSSLAEESQEIQDALDRILFSCFGIDAEEATYISARLEEML